MHKLETKYGFAHADQEHIQHLVDMPFPWDQFKKLVKEGAISQRNKRNLPDGGEYYEVVFPKAEEGLAFHFLLTLWKESFGEFPATVNAIGEEDSIVIQTQFHGPNPYKK